MMPNPLTKKDLLDQLNDVESDDAKKALVRLFESYLNPAFGALPKREIEIVMFQVLQDLKIFDKNPDQYSMLSSLRVTRSKARALLYESNLRLANDIDDELVEALKDPILLKDSDKVCLELDNPLLIDHLKHVLKELNFITDGSFSPDLIKLTPEAYKALLNNKFEKIPKKDLNKALIECGAKKDISVKSVLTGVLKTVGKKVAAEAGDQVGEHVGDYIGEILDRGEEFIKDVIKGDNKED
jgi:hypothetical protein